MRFSAAWDGHLQATWSPSALAVWYGELEEVVSDGASVVRSSGTRSKWPPGMASLLLAAESARSQKNTIYRTGAERQETRGGRVP